MATNTPPATGQSETPQASTGSPNLNPNLTLEEVEVLIYVLDNYLSDLRYEISDTDNKDFKHMLQHRQQLLKQVFGKLQLAETAAVSVPDVKA